MNRIAGNLIGNRSRLRMPRSHTQLPGQVLTQGCLWHSFLPFPPIFLYTRTLIKSIYEILQVFDGVNIIYVSIYEQDITFEMLRNTRSH